MYSPRRFPVGSKALAKRLWERDLSHILWTQYRSLMFHLIFAMLLVGFLFFASDSSSLLDYVRVISTPIIIIINRQANKWNKQCGRRVRPTDTDTVCPRLPPTLTFDRLTLKMVCESHLRWVTFFQIREHCSLCIMKLFAMYATDEQTDRQTDGEKQHLLPPSYDRVIIR